MTTAAFIAGTGAVACRRWYGERTAAELSSEAIRLALADAGLRPSDVDGLYTTQVGWFAPQEKFIAQRAAEALGITARAHLEAECGGASSLVALRCAAADVAAGRVEAALVWAADVEVPVKMFDPAKHLHLVEQGRSFYGPYGAAYGLIGVVSLYAMSAQAYMHRHGLKATDVAPVAVGLRAAAARHPLAYLREPITLADVLESRVVSPPLHFLECAPWSDGAAAVVVTRAPAGVGVRAFGEAHDPTSFAPLSGDVARFDNASRAAADACARAGIAATDLHVAEVYGAFGVTELQLYEDLGFFEPGSAPRAAADGRTAWINPCGGRLSFGHPPYVTPLYEVIEVCDQLRGRASARQVPGAALGLVHAEHGVVNGSVVAILEAAA